MFNEEADVQSIVDSALRNGMLVGNSHRSVVNQLGQETNPRVRKRSTQCMDAIAQRSDAQR